MVKIPRAVYDRAKVDLHRPHRFAAERIGFFSTRCSRMENLTLIHCVAYTPVDDDHYVDDHTVGARIGSLAITAAMSHAINESAGQFHVHWHGGSGLPSPSQTDSSELPSVARAIRNANTLQPSGWIVLGDRDAYASVQLAGNAAVVNAPPVSIIGFPTVVNNRLDDGSNQFLKLRTLLRQKIRGGRYSRQSFLGSESCSIIACVNVGIVGLGGGGSHIVQQMAHLGFRRFVLCDNDRINHSNLNRLVSGTRADVKAKRLKVEIARRVVEKLHKDAEVVGHGANWEGMVTDLAHCDIVFGCVDTYAARRDLEGFCRRIMVPYVDVGMDVHKKLGGGYEIDGQVIVSMPGHPCMHCVGFLNDRVLGEEAEKYGKAGSRPQVVWSNGVLCSAAVGLVVDILTDWSGNMRQSAYLSFKGSDATLSRNSMFSSLAHTACRHFPFACLGDPVVIRL